MPVETNEQFTEELWSTPPAGARWLSLQSCLVDYIDTSWLGDLILLLSTWALWYHLLAGLRHLIWDTGRCLEIEAAERLGKLVIAGSVVLTLITIILV